MREPLIRNYIVPCILGLLIGSAIVAVAMFWVAMFGTAWSYWFQK